MLIAAEEIYGIKFPLTTGCQCHSIQTEHCFKKSAALDALVALQGFTTLLRGDINPLKTQFPEMKNFIVRRPTSWKYNPTSAYNQSNFTWRVRHETLSIQFSISLGEKKKKDVAKSPGQKPVWEPSWDSGDGTGTGEHSIEVFPISCRQISIPGIIILAGKLIADMWMLLLFRDTYLLVTTRLLVMVLGESPDVVSGGAHISTGRPSGCEGLWRLNIILTQ
ncbi:hypothetical protein CEXT_247511 [Caerostris extrusa]|uniref:Uncharacterized protein n=1 Tax=Caerostris extrusa TaxID=172846 RepID=A0AAV4XX62_CAEEX|nr:hypothetical protein CEXT_247511 [Caerostris extrusa]